MQGCGACGGFWKWFKPPHKNFFKSACIQHDIDYDNGGSELDKHIADIKLKYEMTRMVKNHFYKRKPISRIWYLIITQAYYYGVRIFGKNRFNQNERKIL